MTVSNQTMTHRRRTRLLAGAAAVAMLSAPTVAQQATGEADEDSGVFALEEIRVTARRRDERLLDVPVAMTNFGGPQMSKQGIQSIVELAKFSPNVTLEVSRGTNTTLSAFIRGVGQQDPVAGFEAGVGLYVDDVYINRPQAAVLDIFDVERVEVLRGPQGTLYGRNTIGGAIKYVTARLEPEAEMEVRGTFGTDQKADLVVSGSLPVSDTFRVGGAFATLNRDGFGENRNLEGVDNYNKKILAGRVSAEWLPSDSLFVRLTGDYIRDTSAPRGGHRLIPGQLTGAPVLDDVFDTRAGLNVVEQEVEAGGVHLTAEWDITPNVQLKNILAYREDSSATPIDFDSLPQADLDVPALYKNDQFSEELQLNFSGEDLNGILGFYYLDANALTDFDVLLATTGDAIGLPGLNATTLGDVKTETWAVFGDFTYDITETLSLNLGARFTSDERTSRVERQTLIGGFSERFGGDATPIATTSDFSGSAKFESFTPKVTLTWKPAENHNVYFTFSEGFKGGGFDPRGQTTAAPDLNGDGVVGEDDIFEFMKFDPETVDSFELGWKGALADGRINFSLAAFMSNYTDVQIPGSVGVDTDGDGVSDTFTGITSNAADADINGVEFEGQALVARDMGTAGDSLNFAWTVGYLDAEFNTFIDAFGEDVADERVFQNTPEWTLSGALTYATPMNLMNRDGLLSIITSVAFRSEASQFEQPNPFLDQPAFALWDTSLVWESDDEDWQVALHGKNLTNKKYIVSGYDFVNIGNDGSFTPTLGLEGTLTAFFGDPRQVFLTVERRF
ncbi:TonB-dependent receptor [Yunchengibacter salinarum]|uniref:TonB-dependent receptor n=1 Tax=Yunchengibacter salinarum TaxID=3133399 RepID=UPI0035B5933F